MLAVYLEFVPHRDLFRTTFPEIRRKYRAIGLLFQESRCMEQVTGSPAEVRPLPATSDLFTVQKDFGLQGIHFGWRGDSAHAAAEYVELEDPLIVVKVITLLAIDWFEVDEN